MSNDSQEWTSEESREAIRKVIEKAGTDPEFRRKALSDAGAAIAEVAGKPLPEGYKLQFVDNDGADQTIVLPDGVGLEDELDRVAGGVGYLKIDGVDGEVTSGSSTSTGFSFGSGRPRGD